MNTAWHIKNELDNENRFPTSDEKEEEDEEDINTLNRF